MFLNIDRGELLIGLFIIYFLGVFVCLVLRHKIKDLDIFESICWPLLLCIYLVVYLIRFINFITEVVQWFFDVDYFKNKKLKALREFENETNERLVILKRSAVHLCGTRYSTIDETLSISEISLLISNEVDRLQKTSDSN